MKQGVAEAGVVLHGFRASADSGGAIDPGRE
jgi:hypothetical protein